MLTIIRRWKSDGAAHIYTLEKAMAHAVRNFAKDRFTNERVDNLRRARELLLQGSVLETRCATLWAEGL